MAVTDKPESQPSPESQGSVEPYPRTGSGSKRVGYVIGAAVNLLLLWVAHQLLDWEWPGFLTDDFDEVLPWITASCLISVAGYVFMFVRIQRLFPKLVNDAATAAASFLVSLRMLEVFPFDFESYGIDWTWLIRLVIIVALVGSVIGFAVSATKLLLWPLRQHY